MRITTSITWSMHTGEVLEHSFFEYSGPVAECKGGGEALAMEREQLQLQRQAFDLMQARQQQVNTAVSPYLRGNVGYDPTQLALMKSSFLNQNALDYNQAGKNVMTALARRGSASSQNPVGGDFTRGIAGLEGAMASNRASGLQNIDISNLQTALTNKFNAASLINGQAAQMSYPISSFGQGASSALSSYIQAANSGFGSSFARGLGGMFGGGLGQAISGGLGTAMSKVGFG